MNTTKRMRTWGVATVAALLLLAPAACGSDGGTNGGVTDAGGGSDGTAATTDLGTPGGPDTIGDTSLDGTGVDGADEADAIVPPDLSRPDTGDPPWPDVPDESDTGGPPLFICQYHGGVIDMDDQPIAGLRVILCDADICYTTHTGGDGRFALTEVESRELAWKALGAPKGFVGVTVAVAPCTEEDNELGSLRLARLPETGPEVEAATGGTVEPLPGLFLELPPDLHFPGFEEHSPIRAVAIAPDKIHPLLVDQIPPVLAAWAFDPYGTKASGPITYRVPTPAGGTAATLYVLDYETGRFLPLPSSQEAGEIRATASDESHNALSWLVLVQAD